jgi:structural maintenance of chromosome 4
VGPNGSGKSNVIDAMLFVFGKRAKQLRLNKVSELIHNSTYHRDVEMARVSVYFHEIIDTSDDEQGYDIIPGSDFVVSRTAHKSNKSDYYINDRKSNFKEVTDLLKKKGIDLDNNRFLILQGEVEQISMMKPKGQTEHETGLLEYLEDIIGTDKYIEKIDEAGKMLEGLQEGRQAMVNRLKIAERERNGLEPAKKAAEAYIEKEIEFYKAKRLISRIYVSQAAINMEKIQSNLSSLEDKLAKEAEKCRAFTEMLNKYEGKYNEGSQEFDDLKNLMSAATGEFAEFERRDIQFREDIKHLKAKLKKAKDKAHKDAKKAESVQEDIQKIKLEIPILEKRTEDAAERVIPAEEEMEAMIAGTKEEKEDLLGQLRIARAELAPWEKQMIDVKSKVDVSQSEIDMLEKSARAAETKYDEACRSLKVAKETSLSKIAEAKGMAAQVEKLKAKVAAAAEEEARATADAKETETSAKELRGKVEQRKSEASQRASHSAAMSALAKARDSNAIPGIRGRLGDLGAIDPEYDVAISTACPPLDYIVVDTTSAAQRCVDLLRSNNLGVATFLILEKQVHLKKFLTETVDTPEKVPRLFDLVKCDSADIKLAFYFALRDTLVANDLDQASRIAYSGNNKRFRRVVTLKGEMINENGTMSGGGAKPRGGRMCLGKNPVVNVVDQRKAADEASKAEDELKELAKKVADARSRVASAISLLRTSKKELKELETSIVKANMEAESSKTFAEELEQRLPELKSAMAVPKEHTDRIRALNDSIDEYKQSMLQIESKSESARAKVSQLEQALENLGGKALKNQRELVATLQAAVVSAEADLAKKVAQIKNCEKQVVKLLKDSKKAEQEEATLQTQHDEAVAQFKALEEDAFKVVERMNATKQELETKELEVLDLRKEFEAKQKEVSIIRQVEVDIENELEQQRQGLAEEMAKKKHWEHEDAAMCSKLQELMQNGVPDLSATHVEEANSEEVQYRITVLEEEMGSMDINPDAIEAWTKSDDECNQRSAELESATADRDRVRAVYDELRKKRLDEFMSGFNIISLKLKEMYQMITMGGDAELELVDSLDPFSEGILFSVRPPKKSWKNIANLSGGEKTLSSLSLVFALHHFKPTPLYVMDEIDAALDFKNVSIVGNYIRERTKNAQFVIISLRNNMFELADRLVGIYKTDNATKSIPVNPREFTVGAV